MAEEQCCYTDDFAVSEVDKLAPSYDQVHLLAQTVSNVCNGIMHLVPQEKLLKTYLNQVNDAHWQINRRLSPFVW